MKDRWRLVSLLGSWHIVSRCKAYRFYVRINQDGEVFYFADYRVEDLVSRHHKLLSFEDGIDASFKIANQTAIDLTREELAEL